MPRAPSILRTFAGLLAVSTLLPAQGKAFLSAKEALALAFADCEVRRVKHVLDDEARGRVAERSGEPPPRAMVYAYEARKEGRLVGTAWFDRHCVRTKQQLLMVVVSVDRRVERVEVLRFEEPLEYLPRDRFLGQFIGRRLDRELSTRGAIRPVAGATLTVGATLAAVRRILAVHEVLHAAAESNSAVEHEPAAEQQPRPAFRPQPKNPPKTEPKAQQPKNQPKTQQPKNQPKTQQPKNQPKTQAEPRSVPPGGRGA